jgi:hypothetical protein
MDLKSEISNIKFKQNLTKGQILSKYCALPLLGSDDLKGDDGFDKFTMLCTRSTSTILTISAAIVAAMALFVAATYILALSPAIAGAGLTAGYGVGALGFVGGIAGSISLTCATATVVPAVINGVIKSTGDKGEDKFVKEVKNVIDRFVSERLEGVKTLNHYGLNTRIDDLLSAVDIQLTTALNNKFRENNKIPEEVKDSIRATASQLIDKQVTGLQTVTSLPVDKEITFVKVYNITSDIAKVSGIEQKEVEDKAVEVFKSLLPTDKSSTITDRQGCESYKGSFEGKHNRLTIAAAVDDILSSSKRSGNMAHQVSKIQSNTATVNALGI